MEDQVSHLANVDACTNSDIAGSIGLAPSSSQASIGTAQTVREISSASSSSVSSEDDPRHADGDIYSTRPASSGTDMTDRPPGDVGEGLRFLLKEYGLDETWDSFVSQLLKEIIESQSSFQVSVDRNEVSFVVRRCFVHIGSLTCILINIPFQDDFGLLTLSDQLESGSGSSSSFEVFGLSARQNQQLHNHGNVGNNSAMASNWRHRNQVCCCLVHVNLMPIDAD